MSQHVFKCGCQIPIVGGYPKIDFQKLNFKCPKMWDMYCAGQTQSIFQLESTGRSWSKKLQPRNIEDAAALIAIIRPGVLQSFDKNGRCLADVFCERKNGGFVPDPDDPLASILSKTQMINIYQESTLKIASQIAGFNGKQSMQLLKGLGKKDAELIYSLNKEFVDGCESTKIVSKEQAQHIFDNIKASARYSFNLSHSVSYAVLGVYTAWVKSHLPYHYICSWLRSAKNDQDKMIEIRKVISEARRLSIQVAPPSIMSLPQTDFFVKDKVVYFGLNSIKNCGIKSLNKILLSGFKDFDKISWLEFLTQHSNQLTKSNMVAMVRVGCFDCYKEYRVTCEFEYLQWLQLSSPDKKKCTEIVSNNPNIKRLVDVLQLVEKPKPILKDIVNILNNPPIVLKDSDQNIIDQERELMGVNISCSSIERASITQAPNITTDINNLSLKEFNIIGEIQDLREFKIKKGSLAGKFMAIFTLVDSNGECEIVCFPTQLNVYEAALYENNIILFKGKRSNRGQSLITEEIFEV